MTFAAVRKIILPVFLLVSFIIVIYLGTVMLRAPGIAEEKTRESLTIMGLETRLLPRPKPEWGRIVYNNAVLDEDEISTIGKLTATYNPLTLIFTNRLNSLSFENLSLIGEWDPAQPAAASFSGWIISPGPEVIARLPVKKLSLKQAKISVLTPALGGLSLDFDFEGALDEGLMEFQSSLKSAQKYISFSGKADGVISDDHSNIDIELDEGKFEVPDANIRASRIHGWLNFMRDKSLEAKIMAELRAGGITILDMPWQNASATVEIKDGTTKIYSEAKSVGVEGVELGLNLLQEPGEDPGIYGELHAAQGQLLYDYITQQTDFPLPAADLTIIKHANELKIDYVYSTTTPPDLQYRMNTMPDAPVKSLKLDQKPD